MTELIGLSDKKMIPMKRLIVLFSLSVLLSVVYSCSNEYDLSNVDKNICIGGEQFVFPLVKSNKMIPDSIMNISGIKELERDDLGNYFFHYSGSIQQSISFQSLGACLEVPVQQFNVKVQRGFLPVLTDEVLDVTAFPFLFTITDPDSEVFKYDLSAAAREGLIRLDSVYFQPAAFKIDASVCCSGVSSFPALGLNLVMDIPDRFDIVDSRMHGNTLICLEELTPAGYAEYEPVCFSMVDLSESPADFIYEDTVFFESLNVVIPDAASYKAIMGRDLSVYISATMEDVEGGGIIPEVVYCLVDRTTDPVVENIPMNGIPDFMKNAVLSLDYPVIRFDLTTNATVPVNVNAEIASYRDREISAVAFAEFCTPFVDNPSETVSRSYILADENPMANDDGPEFVQTDLRPLVNEVPESIEFFITPSTYYDKSDPKARHLVYLNSNADIDINYDFSLPLSFGSDLMMEFRDTLTNMPEILGEILTKCDISVIGEASSTLPVDLVLQMNFLDVNGNSLDMYSTESIIKGSSSGIPSVMEYSVDVKKSANAGKISSLEIIMGLKNGQSVIMTENDYIQLSVQVSVPGGIEI